MCSALRLNEVKASNNSKLGFIGETFTLNTKDKKTEAVWDGHAKKETLSNSWLKSGWIKAIIINVDGYTEKDPDGKTKFYCTGPNRKIAVVTKDNKFRVVTRSARGREKKVNDRFPLLVNNKE